MTGREYLDSIRDNLGSGRNQHRMGQNVLRAFGYVRRRSTAIQQINDTLNKLDLIADPPIDSDMPLRSPRIRFSFKPLDGKASIQADDPSIEVADNVHTTPSDDDDGDDSNLPEPAFTVSELKTASTTVERVSPNATLQVAYTKMVMGKYSQLVVANNDQPRRQDIKGIVSFQSIAKALMNGNPTTVGHCIDDSVPYTRGNADLKSIVSDLSGNDVALVVGQDNQLQGIVTAWDLAEEFAVLVDPFKRIGEIEARLQSLLERRLGKEKVADFLNDRSLSGDDPIEALEELTMGELQRVLEFPDHWNELSLAFDRRVFITSLNEAREYRNRLMHFRDPLDEAEMTRLTNFCDMVREIQL